ncbi:MAG: 23S rRNA (pseudouridine(1915)-N(3))-methyltransferase RlmH [Proteobacteria bacterium]|nr:23S rRNA (pseudouridine(1915)-N(3))-methyltransferase RlmH [Pseudomonadota bacterium]MCH8321562.1 23S rRNA (pseudouridine(1915)-N(3))-methyltransferase RlmH [Pseudomonadota bacterium]
MKITIIAVGKSKASPAEAIGAEYIKRLPWSVEVIEVEEKRPLKPLEKMKSEGKKILLAIPKGAYPVALDKSGKTWSSREFSKTLEKWFNAGGSHIVFLIGGPDGLSEAVLEKAPAKLSFGPMTWPHQLARVMLLEQLYRAFAIAEGHPYHK